MLKTLGLDITAANIKAHLSKYELDKAGNAMRTAIRAKEGANDKYKTQCKDDHQRREWLAAYIIDPDVGKLLSINKHTREAVDGVRGTKFGYL